MHTHVQLSVLQPAGSSYGMAELIAEERVVEKLCPPPQAAPRHPVPHSRQGWEKQSALKARKESKCKSRSKSPEPAIVIYASPKH